jgi:hypothetical protein
MLCEVKDERDWHTSARHESSMTCLTFFSEEGSMTLVIASARTAMPSSFKALCSFF